MTRALLPEDGVLRQAPPSSHFGSVANEIELRPARTDHDQTQFARSRAASRTGIPIALMTGPSARVATGSSRTGDWRPPLDCTLCGGAMGFAKFSPGGADLLRWYRSHGTECERQARAWLGIRVAAAGWAASPSEAWWLADRALMRVRRGTRRTAHFPPASMGRKRFDEALAEASARLRFGILDAEHAYLTAAGETPGKSHTGNRGNREVHYPSRPNCFLRKTRPENPIPLDKAA